jgi:hypothetical protein
VWSIPFININERTKTLPKLFSKLTDIKSIIAAASLAAVIAMASTGAVFADGANHSTNNLDQPHVDKACHTHNQTHNQKPDTWVSDRN